MCPCFVARQNNTSCFSWWVPEFYGISEQFCCSDVLIYGFIGMFKLNGMRCDFMFSALCAVLCLDGEVRKV